MIKIAGQKYSTDNAKLEKVLIMKNYWAIKYTEKQYTS